MKKLTFTEPSREMTFDTMEERCIEFSTGVRLPEVQNQALLNVALIAPETAKDNLNWAVQQMASIEPGDGVESMLAQQMIGLNSLMMKSCKLAQQPGQTVVEWDMHVKHAARLSKAFASLSAALDKHRGKGDQTIVVKHQQVNVGDGGQAIVGNVNRGEGNGKSE